MLICCELKIGLYQIDNFVREIPFWLQRSKSEARSLVNYLKPDVLFLEVCRQRKEDMLRTVKLFPFNKKFRPFSFVSIY